MFAGETDTGHVYEQQIEIEHKDGGVMQLRRITTHLYEATRDGETEIHVLTNMSKKALPSVRGSEVYRGPKKKVVKEYDPAVKHVSTAQVLKERKLSISVAKNNKYTP